MNLESLKMNANGYPKNVMDLIGGENIDLPKISDSGVRIRIIDIDGWLRVMIELGENTSHAALRDVIPLALNWRDKLLEYQGPWLIGGKNQALIMWSDLNEAGMSYSKIAESINKSIMDNLTDYSNFLNRLEKVRPELKTVGDFRRWQFETNSFTNGLENARDLLELIRFPPKNIESTLDIILNQIQEGDLNFSKDFPVSQNKVRTTLRKWREGRVHKIYRKRERKRNKNI